MPAVKEFGDQTFTVPGAAGSYAPERWTCGDVKSGMAWDAFQGITASVYASVTGMVVELWLPRFGATKGSVIDGDYHYSGKSITTSGAETWALAGFNGAQIRVKSGGSSGSAVVSCSAF